MTLLYIKVEANVVTNDFIRIPMAHHAHKLDHTALEEETYELLFLDSLLISYNTDCFSLEVEGISFPLSHHMVEAEQKRELQTESSSRTRTNLNNYNSYWKYNPVEGINIVHYHDRIYVPKTLRKRVLKLYHFYLPHPGGDRLAQILNTVCRWSGIFDQSHKLCRTFK